MNLNYEILNLTWRSKSTKGEFISFYIIPKIKSKHFTSNPEDLKLSLDAKEIYSVAKSDYINNKSYHDQKIIAFSENISSRFTGNSLLFTKRSKKDKKSKQKNAPANNADCNLSTPAPIQRSSSEPVVEDAQRTPTKPMLIRASSDSVSPVKRSKLSFSE